MYLAGEANDFWFAAFCCPCGCKDVIRLSLIEKDKPSWSVTLGKGGDATLEPSIWRRQGCRSHFWIVDGRPQFVYETDRNGQAWKSHR